MNEEATLDVRGRRLALTIHEVDGEPRKGKKSTIFEDIKKGTEKQPLTGIH